MKMACKCEVQKYDEIMKYVNNISRSAVLDQRDCGSKATPLAKQM